AVRVDRRIEGAPGENGLDEGRDCRAHLVADTETAAILRIIAVALVDDDPADRGVFVDRSVRVALERKNRAPKISVEPHLAAEFVHPRRRVRARREVRVGKALLAE